MYQMVEDKIFGMGFIGLEPGRLYKIGQSPKLKDQTASGNPLLLNSAEAPLTALTVYGKSTQDGTPSPDNPVPIVSAGDSGEIGVSVGGGQLLNLREGKSGTGEGVTYTRNEDGTYLATGTATGRNGNVWFLGGYGKDPELPENVLFTLQPGVYTARDCILFSKETGSGNGTFTLTKTLNITGIRNPAQEVGKSYNDVIYPMLNAGSTALAFEPYVTPQTLTLSTPGGLPGIPVSSGGNYTDESGQQWICDEIDLARGKYVHRVKYFVVTSDTNIRSLNRYSTAALDVVQPFRVVEYNGQIIKSSAMMAKNFVVKPTWNVAEEAAYTIEQTIDFNILNERIGTSAESTSEEAKAAVREWLKDNPLTFLCQLITPIETDLPAEEISAYKALHTYTPNTTVSNDAGAWMKAGYKTNEL